MSTNLHEDGEGGAAPGGAATTGSVGNTPGTDTGWGVNPPKKKIVRRKHSVKEFMEMDQQSVIVDEAHVDDKIAYHKQQVASKLAEYKDHIKKGKETGLVGHYQKSANYAYDVAQQHKLKLAHYQKQRRLGNYTVESEQPDEIIDESTDDVRQHAVNAGAKFRSNVFVFGKAESAHSFAARAAESKGGAFVMHHPDHNYHVVVSGADSHRMEKNGYVHSPVIASEAIKGWKNAHSDIMKSRSDASAASNSVVLHQLRADGRPQIIPR